MPAISNPHGVPLDTKVRATLLARAKKQDAILIEDDAYADTRFDGRPSRPLLAEAPERVFHVGTFSKTLAPGLRVGWLVAPPGFLKEVLEAKQTMDLQANSLAQTLLEFYLQGGAYPRHLARLQRAYALRAQKLAAQLRRQLPQLTFRTPRGGFSLWLESDLEVDESVLYEEALKRGVTFDRGSPFCSKPSPRLSLRLSYSAVPKVDMAEGVSRLSKALESVS